MSTKEEETVPLDEAAEYIREKLHSIPSEASADVEGKEAED